VNNKVATQNPNIMHRSFWKGRNDHDDWLLLQLSRI